VPRQRVHSLIRSDLAVRRKELGSFMIDLRYLNSGHRRRRQVGRYIGACLCSF
jgi:hypothetical protein